LPIRHLLAGLAFVALVGLLYAVPALP